MIRIGKSLAPQANLSTGMTSSVLLSALGKLLEVATATKHSFSPTILCSQISPELLSGFLHPVLNQGMRPARRKKDYLTCITQNKNPASAGTSKEAGQRQTEAAESNSSSY